MPLETAEHGVERPAAGAARQSANDPPFICSAAAMAAPQATLASAPPILMRRTPRSANPTR